MVISLYSCSNFRVNEDLQNDFTTWREYLGGPDRNHYSSLNQINATNVHKLQVAWIFQPGDTGTIETNPIIIGDTLLGIDSRDQSFALNAKTGEKI